jgi:hypothetical protein
MDEGTASNSLGAIISNLAARRFVYSTYVLALLVVGATQVALTSLGITNPDWLVATLAVLGYLGVPVAGLAVANTSVKAADGQAQPQHTAAARQRPRPAAV